MNGVQAVLSVLPESWQKTLKSLPGPVANDLREIRLHSGQVVELCFGDATAYLGKDGTVSATPNGAVRCTEETLDEIIDRACEHSRYAHQEELKRGFVTAPSGCRIGLAGTAVAEQGTIMGYRSFQAACLRVAREHRGCAAPLFSTLFPGGTPRGVLLCGEPSSGKTSLLRDLARLGAERFGAVAVVDERGELAAPGGLERCDVLRFLPKAQGIEQAVRCLSPRLVVIDELGDEQEIIEVTAALYRGVPVLASVHGTRFSLYRRPSLVAAITGGAFSMVAELQGRRHPGTVASVQTAEEWYGEMVRHPIAVADGAGSRQQSGNGVAVPRA